MGEWNKLSEGMVDVVNSNKSETCMTKIRVEMRPHERNTSYFLTNM